jgi:subtilisin-like proprotein convertase family protein
MKKHSRNNRSPGAWVLGGVASVLMCVSALGQYVTTQSTPITINDDAIGSPYPSVIDLTTSNIVGTIEKVTVTLNNVKHGYANDVGVLLKAPDGSTVVLMRNGGGGQAINGATLTFDDSGSALPAFSAIATGTYAPGDFDAAADFSAPAPAGTYGANLAGLKNASAKGKWSLYVEDVSPPNSGTIDSWTLNLYTTPLITLATNYVNLNENGSSSNLSFTVQDSSIPAAGYTVSFGGAATNNFVTASGSVTALAGTATLTPKLNVFGTNTLTVFVSDGLGSVQSDVTVAIKHVNQAPTITITNSATIAAGSVSPVINAVVADVDPDNASSSLTISVSSSDTNLVSPAGVFFDPANSGGLRTFTVVPRGAFTGTATLTFTVKDAGNLTGTATLPVTVQSVSHPIFASTNLLGLSDSGKTNSSIVVSNVAGAIGNLTVSVSGLKGVAGDNLSLALVPPTGPAITLLQDAGSAGPNTFAQLAFAANTGTVTLPAADSITPVALKANGLSTLVGTTPNGTWALWATNGGAAGQLTGGWVLNVFAAPTITTTVTNITMPEESSTGITFTVADIDGAITNVSDVTITSQNTALLTVTGKTFDLATGIGSAQLNAIFSETGPQFGKTTVTVTAKDNNDFTVVFKYNVTVTFKNHSPTISFILRQVTRAGTPIGPVAFTVHDVDISQANGAPEVLTVSAVSDNQKLLPDSNILLGGSGDDRTFTLFPLGTNTGTANLTFSVSDGTATTTESFQLFAQSPGNPLFVNASQISVPANANASPYPSTIGVSNLLGTISKVEVTLFNITHSGPDNMNALLVSPSGKKVLLMGHAGGANALANTTIQFSDSAAAGLPDSAQIISGIYQPTSLGTVATFPSTPAGTINTTLAAFDGLNSTNANGLWSLYIVDDGLGKGVIVNGWQLSIETDPFVGQIADVTLKENDKTLPIQVSVGDDQPGVNITVSAVSADSTIVQAAFEAGSGASRTLDITPVPFKTGSNILVTVTAQSGLASSSTNFHVTVYPIDLPPVVSSIGNATTPATTPSPMTTLTAWDPQNKTPLTVTASSSDTKLIPNGNITITGPTTTGTTNGHSIFQYGVSVRSADADVTGTSVITVLVSDTVGKSTSATFNASVTKALVYLSADGSITIPEGLPIAGTATNYPSKITVANLDGRVTGAKVTLLGFSHQFPQDVDVLLVSPDASKSVVLMAHVGGGTAVSNLRLNFDDSGSDLSTATLSSGTFAPTSLDPAPAFPAPAPASGYGSTLAALKDVNPNGDWKLYVLDDSFPLGGSITGWMLTLQTGPAFDVANLGPQTTKENTTKVISFSVLDESADPASLVVTAATNSLVSATNVVNLIANLQVTNNAGGNRTLIITPSKDLPSTVTNIDATTTIFLTVTDTNNNKFTASFPLTVSFVDQSPIVQTPTNTLVVNEGGTITTTFALSDVDSTLYTSNLVVTSTEPSLIPNTTNGLLVTVSTNRVVPGTSGTVTVKITPISNVFGTNTVSLSITDGATLVTSTVTVDVIHQHQAPTITGLPATVTTIAGNVTPASAAFTVGSLEGVPATSLTVTATSANQALVPNGNIVLGGTAEARTIQLTPLGTVSGTDTITLKVGDGTATNSYTFDLKILPPPSTLFGNSQVANIVGNATNLNSSPYPITFDVADLVGSIYNVSLEMRGFSNSAPANLDALLVSPDGIAVMLTSGGGGTTPVNGLDLIFDDSGADLTTVNPLVSGTYHPTYITKRVLPAGTVTPLAPQSGYLSRMSAFSSDTKVNGTWRLYLNDLTLGDFGKITGGFYLNVVTKPGIQITTTTPVVIPENGSSNVSFTISDSVTAVSNLTVTAATDNKVLLPISGVTIQALAPLSDGKFVAKLTPNIYQNGSANITLTATRTDGASSTAVIPITVPATNFTSIISRLLPQSTPENTSIGFQFLVSDVDTALSNLTVRAVSLNQTVIGDTNIAFAGSTNNANVLYGLPASAVPQTSALNLSLLPNPYQVGNATIQITVSDSTAGGINVSSNFVFTVTTLVYGPTISAIANQTVSSGATTPAIGFQVNSLNQTPPHLTISAVSSDTTKIKNSSVVITPATASAVTNRTLAITAEAGAKGPVTITLTVTDTDNNLSANTQFTVTVLPSPIHTFANTKAIVIPDSGAATPYPSTIDVDGLVGKISKISVTLTNFAHRYPADVGVLLVSPAGQKIVLMNKAGGGAPVTNVNLTFDQAASTAIPQVTTATTGSYRPADYKAAGYDFITPAPAHPYSADLSTLNGASPNGTWSLFVVDDTAPDNGFINGGWALNITTQPQISGLGNLVIQENASDSQAFSIADDSLSGQSYRFGSTSTNSALIPASGIVVSGSNANYTVTVTPAANKFGTNLVTLYATNIDNLVASSTFLVTVPQVLYPPVIDKINDQTTPAGISINVPVNYYDIQVATNQLTVTFQSSNPTLVPVSNISLVGNQAIQVTPAGASSGSSLITVTVTQPANQFGLSSKTSFTVNVTPVLGLFGTNQVFTINDRAPGSPYPSTFEVSGLNGNIASATISVMGLKHGFPSDISMLLVGPQGQKVVLMSRAGSGVGSAIADVNLTFDDAAANSVPATGVIPSGTYKPTDYNSSLVFYPPVTGPYVTNLSVLKGANPNGTWSLYVQDDLLSDNGQITGGWLVKIVTTAPSVSFAGTPPSSTPENTPLTIPLTVGSVLTSGDKLTLTAVSSKESLTGLIANLAVSGPGTNPVSSRTLVITPGANLPSSQTTNNGTATITLTVTDGTNVNTLSFPLTVTYANQAPTLAGLSNQTVPANGSLGLSFTANDVDSPTSSLTVAATSSATALGTVKLTSNGNSQTLAFTPSGTLGQTTVTVTASDGSAPTTTNTFTITVIAAVPPVWGAVTEEQTTFANLPAVVTVPITDAVTPVATLTFAGTSDNAALVSKVNVALVGTNVVATVSLVSNAVGTANVTLTATDPAAISASTSFVLTVKQPSAPELGNIDDLSVNANANVTVVLEVQDEDLPINALTFSGTSSNSALVTGISFVTTSTGASAQITLAHNEVGTSLITIGVTDGFTNLTQSFLLTVSGVVTPPTLKLSTAGNQLRLNFSGAPNAAYRIQTSSDLKTWAEGTTITADSNGAASYTNTVSSTVKLQFFRAVVK